MLEVDPKGNKISWLAWNLLASSESSFFLARIEVPFDRSQIKRGYRKRENRWGTNRGVACNSSESIDFRYEFVELRCKSLSRAYGSMYVKLCEYTSVNCVNRLIRAFYQLTQLGICHFEALLLA